jgi:HSP20 family protein
MGSRVGAVQRAEQPSAIRRVRSELLTDRMNQLFDDIARRAFEIFDGRGRMFGHELEDWFKAESEYIHPVHVRAAESENAVEVQAEVPGFNENELTISVDPRRLTISGKRESSKEEKEGKTLYSEACSDEIFRVVDLPVDVDADKVTATLKNGVIHLKMPKAAKGRTVPIHPKAVA